MTLAMALEVDLINYIFKKVPEKNIFPSCHQQVQCACVSIPFVASSWTTAEKADKSGQYRKKMVQ